MKQQQKSYYDWLEIPAHASTEEIKRAYRRMALKYHPDRYHLANRHLAERHLYRINEAYAHLKTPEKRALYDRQLRGDNDNMRPGSFWTQFFGLFKAQTK